jgi:hypothetical protein
MVDAKLTCDEMKVLSAVSMLSELRGKRLKIGRALVRAGFAKEHPAHWFKQTACGRELWNSLLDQVTPTTLR